ncbi:hypothetical protein M427DRAFT_133536 [Gonapodya prolifera JEL478]|uniref:Thioredoxin domain-containing protein n=1 Tax=Gonapodya prolifera (strain JEL478) TaxID=1344416 RepID=A0A139AKX0_GONPJ|nr:hypothetical protein M427DRAFT_133536 [Gonapodya prolifera JEL478]|eukprot:KXS17420.1 hypothetical protein M427DRAFT_133536 [Gonapodya prolifera JEL478]
MALIESASSFDAILDAQLAEDGTVYVFLYGNKLPKAGKSWCPDCQVSEPKTYATKANVTLIYVPAGTREEWKLPPIGHGDKNFYRNDPRIHATAVPTLIKWNKVRAGVAPNGVVEWCETRSRFYSPIILATPWISPPCS